ncbi:unnamed protein product [Adineta steineri]|uniref:Death domain-containing protein n=4 Tax=Adineta steineri TaxID=433720 RepID=A0A814S4Q0_9BILA|nr:unnamed protein product [Adineta steineri]CAF3772791.1 unnamed protein product [Adineta steineri]
MVDIILQLTYDNNLFQEQWSDVFIHVEKASISNNPKLILNVLPDYVLTEPINPLSCNEKYRFVNLVIDRLIKNELSIDINDLVNIFTQTLDRSRIDEWNLNFLQTIYQKFKIGTQLCLIPLKINLIEQILQSLLKKTFIFNSEEDYEKWKQFLTQYIFSNSINDDNILNNQNIVTNMQTNFKQFYQHAVQLSHQSPIWLQIATILNLNTISSDSIKQLIQSYKNNIELVKSNYLQLLTMIECLILANRYDDACLLFTKFIIPNLCSIDLETLLHKIIELCPKVDNRDLFTILKLYNDKAPDLCYRLLKRKDFYPWEQLTNGLVDLTKICISYDTIVNEKVFSDLNQLEDILCIISTKAEVYPIINKSLHSIALEATLRWSNPDISWSNHVYRMGIFIVKLIDSEQINDDIYIKFIDALQNRINCENEELNKKNLTFFTNLSNQLGNFIQRLKGLSNNVHSKIASLFLSILNYPFYDEDYNMTFQYTVLVCLLFRVASLIFHENDARIYKPFLDRMYINVKNDNKTMLCQWWTGFWLTIETIPFNNDLCNFIQSLSFAANYHLYLFDIHLEKLLHLIIKTQNLLIFQCFKKYIISSILINYENKADEYLNLLIDLLKNRNGSNEIRNEILYTCLLIGLKYKQILVNRRQDLITLNSNLLINYIDDTVINELDSIRIKQAQNDIQQIELCIDRTNMKSKEKKEIIPSWSSKVTKLLNQRADNDWYLLAKHLGFSSSKIKHWTIEIDPCMALLNEWFTIHTTDEAIYNLIKALEEINRDDVVQIIRQEVLTIEHMTSNDLSIQSKHLPPIYLLYHSSKQTLITKLKDHLEKAGYSCQMYDEQINMNIIGADIREAKIVICCINTLYIQSEICSKTFQLILNMKKPFILLCLKELIWLSSENLFKSILDNYSSIEFYDDEKNEEWSENKFIELLGQLRYYVAPDHDMISEEYHHWFVPHLDDLIFFKSFNSYNKNNFILFNNIPLVVHQPQIIISYEWNCQKDVINLYKQLTQLGYRIWLDIFQMEGEDTLIEKYNIAIHQALCLLVCITPTYMKSINCQNEITLANTFNKPIIPLLLKETNSWPPKNHVLSLFTEKSYIDFRHSNKHIRWTGKQFEILLTYLKQIIPQVHTDKSRYLLEMQRPVSALPNTHNNNNIDQRPKRISSAPSISNSRTCSLM